MAFNEYERALEPRSQFRLLNHVLQQQSPPNTATSLSTSQPGGHPRPAWLIAAGAGGAAAVGARAVSRSSSTGQQQRQPQPKPRQLLCDEHQVQELLKTTSPQQNLCELLVKPAVFHYCAPTGGPCFWNPVKLHMSVRFDMLTWCGLSTLCSHQLHCVCVVTV